MLLSSIQTNTILSKPLSDVLLDKVSKHYRFLRMPWCMQMSPQHLVYLWCDVSNQPCRWWSFVGLCVLCTQVSSHLGELPTTRYWANASWTTLTLLLYFCSCCDCAVPCHNPLRYSVAHHSSTLHDCWNTTCLTGRPLRDISDEDTDHNRECDQCHRTFDNENNLIMVKLISINVVAD